MSSNYVIGTGWWCGPEDDRKHPTHGDDMIRDRNFHQLWYKSVCKNTNPEKIIIVDSNSPLKPEIESADNRIEFISLPVNPGHIANHVGKFSGWLRAVLLGLEYSFVNDFDYFVYVEQDVLLKGNGIVEHAIGKMNKPFMFGKEPFKAAQPIQQSFFIVRKDGMRSFIKRLHAINYPERVFDPEWKFNVASSAFLSNVPNWFFLINRKLSVASLQFWNFHFSALPFGFGRSRPINFEDEFYYFQHGSRDELNTFLELNPL